MNICRVCGGVQKRNCICPPCHSCGRIGDKQCYEQHGMKRTEAQVLQKEISDYASAFDDFDDSDEYPPYSNETRKTHQNKKSLIPKESVK